MKTSFDEFAKDLAQSVTRRGALKQFGAGLVGMIVGCFGLVNQAKAGKCAKYGQPCATNADCCSGYCITSYAGGFCGCTKRKDCPNHQTYCVSGVCWNWV